MNFIELALDENNHEAFSQIYFKSFLYLSKDILEKTSRHKDGKSILEELKKSNHVDYNLKKRIEDFQHELKRLREAKASNITDTILYNLKYEEYLEDACKKLGMNLKIMKSYISIFKLITSDCNSIKDVGIKVRYLEEEMQNSESNRGRNAVTLSSVHSSKGLEFDNVYIIDMLENIFPSYTAIEDFDKQGKTGLLEEERRLAYVAITRGRKHVDLIVPDHKGGERGSISRFIGELKAIGDVEFQDLRKEKIAERKKKIEFIEEEKELGILKVGDSIRHKHFGRGQLIGLSLSEDLMIISFKVGRKKLSYKTCIANKIIEKI